MIKHVKILSYKVTLLHFMYDIYMPYLGWVSERLNKMLYKIKLLVTQSTKWESKVRIESENLKWESKVRV
jgi:hypothetical protein